jgi:hypothetical protein
MGNLIFGLLVIPTSLFITYLVIIFIKLCIRELTKMSQIVSNNIHNRTRNNKPQAVSTSDISRYVPNSPCSIKLLYHRVISKFLHGIKNKSQKSGIKDTLNLSPKMVDKNTLNNQPQSIEPSNFHDRESITSEVGKQPKENLTIMIAHVFWGVKRILLRSNRGKTIISEAIYCLWLTL